MDLNDPVAHMQVRVTYSRLTCINWYCDLQSFDMYQLVGSTCDLQSFDMYQLVPGG